MKRTMALFASAALFALGTAAPAMAAPSGWPGCIPTDDGCIPLSDIDETTDIFIAQSPGGGMQGFTDFNDFAAWESNTYGRSFDSADDMLTSGGGSDLSDGDGGDGGVPDGPDSDDGGHHHPVRGDHDDPSSDPGSSDPDGPGDDDPFNDGGGGGFSHLSMARAAAATFFTGHGLSGPSFMLAPGDFVTNLKKIPMVGGGNFDNKISSFATQGGTKNKQAGMFCLKAFCTDGPRVFLNGGPVELVLKFDNSISAVRLF